MATSSYKKTQVKWVRGILGFLFVLLVSCQPAPESTPIMTPHTNTTATTTALPVPSPLPGFQTGNTASFRDQLAVADQFFLTLNAPAPAEGQVYQGWLLSDDETIISTGIIPLAPDGSATLTWNSPNSETLLSRYTQFQITLEPAAGSETPAGPVIFFGRLEGTALANAQRLFVKNEGEPATPLDTAFALGLRAQTDLAAQHVTNAVNAAAIGAVDEMHAHLEHVVNILEGAGGPRYGDHDGNGTAENPGDGFGVISYAGQIARLIPEQAAIGATVATIQAQITVIQDKCLEILRIEEPATAAAQLSELQVLIEQLKSGPTASLYQSAQDSVRFDVVPVE